MEAGKGRLPGHGSSHGADVMSSRRQKAWALDVPRGGVVTVIINGKRGRVIGSNTMLVEGATLVLHHDDIIVGKADHQAWRNGGATLDHDEGVDTCVVALEVVLAHSVEVA